MIYSFTITEPFIPYVRMTQRGKYVNERAQQYIASQEALGWTFKQQMAGRNMIGKHPFFVIISIVGEHIHTKDRDNQEKALLDAMQGIVFENDCWCDGVFCLREDTDLCEGDDGVKIWVTDNHLEFLRDTERRCRVYARELHRRYEL